MHLIRLHAAWQRTAIEPRGVGPQEVTVTLPDRSLPSCGALAVLYRRSFNRPTGLGPATKLYFESGLLPLSSLVRCNGVPVEAQMQQERLDLTDLLRPSNVIEIQVAHDAFAEAAQCTAALRIVEPPEPVARGQAGAATEP